MDLTLQQYGDRELWLAQAEDVSWRFPLMVDWHLAKDTTSHYAYISPAIVPYHVQSLALNALLGPHDILGSNNKWVIPRPIAEAILHKAPGITPRYYYRWPGPDMQQPLPAKAMTKIAIKEAQIPRSYKKEPFVQYVARTCGISASVINVVLQAINREAATWMLEQRQPLDLGFVRLLAVPFRGNWKEIVTFKARAKILRKLANIPNSKDRLKAMNDAGLPEMLVSMHNVGIRRGWSPGSNTTRLDYTIEAIPSEAFEKAVNRIEAGKQAGGRMCYVAEFEATVEQLYEYIIQALTVYARKVSAPFAKIHASSNGGVLRFMPVVGRSATVHQKALRNLPVHIIPPDSAFSLFGKQSDPRLVPQPAPPLSPVPALPSPPDDVRERKVTGDMELLSDGEEPAIGLSVRHDPEI